MKKSILVFLFALLGILSARAYDFEVDGIYYNIISGTDQVEVTSRSVVYSNYSGSVDIPSTVKYEGTTYAVTTIGCKAFYECRDLTTVAIPNSVTTIGERAFGNCSGLTTVTIPESVTAIGEYSFGFCSGLTTVTIPESVTTIGGSAFDGCSGLTTVTIPESVTSIGRSAFSGCSGLTTVEWNAVTCQDPYDVWLFDGCENITSITFGEQVEHIPAYLCYDMDKLTTVTIPESVTSIGRSAFNGCSGLTSVKIGENVISIGRSAFYECSGLRSITIPASVDTIGDYAFRYCSGLRLVTIPNSVTTIGRYAFADCMGLTTVMIGEGVTTIGEYAFSNCSNLTTVTSLSKIPPYCTGENVFFDENKPSAVYYYQTLYVPRGRKAAYAAEREWKKFFDIEEIEATYTVTVNVNDAAMGTVTGGGDYGLGEQVMLAAIPNSGYHFVKWDDGETANPRLLTVMEDITLTAIFAKDNPDNPDNPDIPTANENSEADNFRVYVQNRTIHLSEYQGMVQIYNVAGQCVYNGYATSIPVRQGGLYIVKVGGHRYKVLVR